MSYYTDGTGGDIGAKLIEAHLVNTTTLRITRDAAGDADDLHVAWEVIELRDGSAVQRGVRVFAAGVSIQNPDLSPSVDVNTAYPIGTVMAGSGENVGRTAYVADDIPGAASFIMELAATRVKLTRDHTTAAAVVGWQVVHWAA